MKTVITVTASDIPFLKVTSANSASDTFTRASGLVFFSKWAWGVLRLRIKEKPAGGWPRDWGLDGS